MPFPVTYPIPLPTDPESVDAYARQLKQLLPRGSAFLLEQDSHVSKTLLAMAQELATVDSRAIDLIEESDPRTAVETIADWERALGLPDARVPVLGATLGKRQVAITQKSIARGGQNRAFFVALAAACGHPLQSGPLSTPFLFSIVWLDDVGGVLVAETSYYYRISAINGSGETLACAQSFGHADGFTSTNKLQINWLPVVGATGYRIYGRTAGAELLIGEVGAVTAFVDDGTVTPTLALPSTATAVAEPITRFAASMLRVGFRAGARAYGAAYAYALRFNVAAVTPSALSQADFERVMSHATHSHIAPVFNYD